MAEASRALAEAGRLHGFRVDEVHAPFAGEAVSRYGHPLPASTRAACRRADAVLVALTREPALEGVKAELDLTWRVQRVRLPDGDIAIVSPLVDELEPFVVRARVRPRPLAPRDASTAVGDGATWERARRAGRRSGIRASRSSGSSLSRGAAAADERARPASASSSPSSEHAELVSDLAAASRERTADRRLRPAVADRARRLRADARLGAATSPARASRTRAGCCSPPR